MALTEDARRIRRPGWMSQGFGVLDSGLVEFDLCDFMCVYIHIMSEPYVRR